MEAERRQLQDCFVLILHMYPQPGCPFPAQVTSTVSGFGNGIRVMHQRIYQ